MLKIMSEVLYPAAQNKIYLQVTVYLSSHQNYPATMVQII